MGKGVAMDFENFEFKPLTEGLGFHKKSKKTNDKETLPPLEPRESLKESVQKRLDTEISKSTFQTVDAPQYDESLTAEPTATSSKTELPDLSTDGGLFSKPLPRPTDKLEAPQPATLEIPRFNPRFTKPLVNPAIQDSAIQGKGLIAELGAQAQMAKENATTANKVQAEIKVEFTETSPTGLSMVLDLTVISGLAILFTLGLSLATSIEIIPLIRSVSHDLGAQVGLGLLVFSVAQLYFILSRSFFGQTLGEWSMDIQLGQPKEQEKVSYIFKMILRSVMITITGFITLPVISMITGKDIAGRLSKLKLYTK